MNNTLFSGFYKKVNSKYRKEANAVMDVLQAHQERWDEESTAIKSVRKHHALEFACSEGYEYINENFKGWTATDESEHPCVVKLNKLTSDHWNVNFADTSKDKIDEIRNLKVEIIVGIYNGANYRAFSVHGYSEVIPDSLMKQWVNAMSIGGHRHSQTFSLGRLLSMGGFKIRCHQMDKDEVKDILKERYPRLTITDSMFDK